MLKQGCQPMLVVGLLFKSKSELQAEVDALRQRVQEGCFVEHSEGRSSTQGPSPSSNTTGNEVLGASKAPPSMPQMEPESTLGPSRFREHMNQSLLKTVLNMELESTVPQTLDNLNLNSRDIDDCFKLSGIPGDHI
jgi:hypothetical protein